MSLENEDEVAPDPPVTELFNQQYGGTTIRIMAAWLINFVMYFGVILIFPTLLRKVLVHNQNQGVEYIFMGGLVVLELLATALTPYIVNHPRLGYKLGFIYCFLASMIASVVAMFIGNTDLGALFCCLAIICVANSLICTVSLSLCSFSSFALPKYTKLCLGVRPKVCAPFLARSQ
jgi:hypothetical protein